MKRISRILIFLGLFLSMGYFHTVTAAGEFQADYDVQYAISPIGKTIVTQHVTLTNQLSNFYPQKYSLLIDSDKISNVIATDDGGVITPAISVKDGKTDVALTFNTKALGLGKSLSFVLRYEHAGIASKNGSIWEVYIPGIVNDADVGIYDVSLSTPPTFGEVAYLSPYPANNKKWTKDQMIRGGVSAAYGKNQQYTVNLTYALQNKSLTPKSQTIALPPETAYQHVIIQSLEPRPQKVTKDSDGNWLAEYLVPSLETLTIKSSLEIAVYLNPQPTFVQSQFDVNTYLSQQPYWPVEDEQVIYYAARYKTVREIYDFVVSTLTYDYTRINKDTKRLGAKEVLANPETALCMEFTDLFITLSRASHIPARRMIGYAYTNNKKLRPLSLVTDVLHAWPEYYDTGKKVWIPVDPTWANTTGGQNYFDKLDFNHIVFAIQGANSEQPYPAGFYHDSVSTTKDISVEFSEVTVTPKDKTVDLKIIFPSQVVSGKVATGSIAVLNTSGISVEHVHVVASSTLSDIHIDTTITELLPYGTEYIPIEVTYPQTLTTIKSLIQVTTNNASVSQEVIIHPPYILFTGVMLVLISSGAIIGSIVWFVLWKTGKKK